MNRRFGWAILVAAGMVFGFGLSCYERTNAGTPTAEDAAADEQDANVLAQLNDIKTQVKEINTLLHSGALKVVVVINPEAGKK